jgi:hypothetical protein
VKEPEKKRKKERHTITKPPNTGIAYTIIWSSLHYSLYYYLQY